jgi:hypothetical protein
LIGRFEYAVYRIGGNGFEIHYDWFIFVASKVASDRIVGNGLIGPIIDELNSAVDIKKEVGFSNAGICFAKHRATTVRFVTHHISVDKSYISVVWVCAGCVLPV